ncbi:hypothetical protein [Halobacteriaceae bacterium SHR40]|uniref:hypothetical protein n=1 Tax=Halovenus amylolytica TaxID=2500550 RepID=UPI000FE3BCFE
MQNTVSKLANQLQFGSGLLRSKRVQIALLLAFAVLSAGCMGGGGGGDAGDAADTVPAGVDGVMYFDGEIATDQATTELMDGIIQMDEDLGPDDPQSWDEALEQAEGESDIDVSDFQSATVFFQAPDGLEAENVGDEYTGIIVQSDWEWDELVEAAEEGEMDDYEEQEYNGVTVYVTTTDGEETWVADLGDGTFVLGTEQPVKDAIDTREGDADAFSGDLRDAYDNNEGSLMNAAVDVSDEEFNQGSQFPEISIVTMNYDTDGSEMQFGMQMTTPSEEDANQLASTLNFGLSSVAEDPELSGMAENLEIDNDGSQVTFDYTTTTDELLTLLEETNSGSTGSGFGSQQTAVSG